MKEDQEENPSSKDVHGGGGDSQNDPISDLQSAWVPARVFRIKITEKKGFVAVIENCVQFNSINGAVWRSVNTRHRDFSVVSYM
ncbi:hypothetical protein TNCV_4933731 [Trichonephila clavipes]|nr:hypothetical protein TNCV_4933731 [Trichonephila clavipes]